MKHHSGKIRGLGVAVVRALRRAAVCVYCGSAMCVSATQAAELPIPCLAGVCGGPNLDLAPNIASITSTQSTLNIYQHVDQALINWQSFNISADGTVNFIQPNASSLAINRIFQQDWSRIDGALNANGRIYLINQNGILFGGGARVNVGGLVATSLNITPAAIEGGLLAPAQNNAAAFVPFAGASGPIRIDQGAQLSAAEGGQILMFAPEIGNAGTIRTPGGQTILGAGTSVYLSAPQNDPSLRGLLVELQGDGMVTNGIALNAEQTDPAQLVGQIVAERGNVTLAGLAVNQLGRVTATTSTRSNGSVYLQARNGGSVQNAGREVAGGNGGELVLGARSRTEVTLVDDPTETTVDVNAQPISEVRLEGETIELASRSQINATGGLVSITAQSSWASRPSSADDSGVPPNMLDAPDDSRVIIATDARIDVSGANIELPVERNVIEVELRGSQVADSPAQRDGALRSEHVFVDIRESGTRADGTPWRGTPLANVEGDIATMPRTARERSLNGGTVNLVSQGDLILSEGATIDVSGGSIAYQDGFIRTSQLIGADGRFYNIADADPDRTYVGVVDGFAVRHDRWGVTENFVSGIGGGRFERGYVEGKDAGTVRVVAPRSVLDGDIDASTVTGRNQRRAPTSIASGQLYRPYDQWAVGGRLIIGVQGTAEPVVGGLEFDDGLVLPTLSSAGGAFDPHVDRLPDSTATLRLRHELFDDAGITRVTALVINDIELPEGTILDLAPAASFNLASTSGEIRIDGGFHSAGGTFVAETPTRQLTLGSSAVIDVSGGWVNDHPVFGASNQMSPLAISGGMVTLTGGTVALEAGSKIDVSGGAARSASGSLSYGSAGRINLNATLLPTDEQPTTLDFLDATLEGFGFQQGGTLNLNVWSACISDSTCAEVEDGALLLGSDFFTRGGFGSYGITTTHGDLRVGSNTVIAPTQQNWQFVGDLAMTPTGTPIDQLAVVTLLPVELRRPVDISLSVNAAFDPVIGPYTRATFGAAPELVIERGAAILGDIGQRGSRGARIALSSNTRMLIDGTLEASAGEISLQLSSSLAALEFLPSQAITLGSRARLDVAGRADIVTDDQGQRSGQVRAGGNINVAADRGFFIVDPGATLDSSGAKAQIDIKSSSTSVLGTPQDIASAGGNLSIRAAEGILLNGQIFAASGDSQLAPGGSIDITLDAATRSDPGGQAAISPTNSRDIRIVDDALEVVIAHGAEVPSQFYGVALLPDDVLSGSGADDITLHARNTYAAVGTPPTETMTGAGRITLIGDVQLDARASLTLDAAVLRSDGGDALLSAAYVALGNQQTSRDQALPAIAPVAGPGSLRVDAEFIELFGTSTATGFESIALNSRSDLRLRGLANDASTTQLLGAFTTAGDLSLSAQQIYPTTMSTFTLSAVGTANDSSQIRTSVAPGEAGDVYSVGGTVRMLADSIVHEGVLRAPLGTLELIGADEVVLGSGSLLSTTASESLLLFGQTQGGFDWAYRLPNGTTLVFGEDDRALPAQRVSLEAPVVDARSGSTIDVRGGGDLLAYEWIPGIGGTKDFLASPTQFAILPTASLRHAPFDPSESPPGSRPGDSIYLPNAIGDLPAGTYALLPARYALLPGAYLVSATDGYQDIVPGETVRTLEGGVIGAGRLVDAGTGLGETRYRGFTVRPGSAARTESQYELTLASDFFSAADTDFMRLPVDAGTLALLPRSELELQGTLLADAGSGGRGGIVEVTAERLRVTGTSGAVVAGEVAISSAELDRLSASSVLLGASAEHGEDGVELTSLAREVTIDDDARLAAFELIIAASESISIGEGATLAGEGAGTANFGTLTTNADAAVIRLAAGAQAELSRSATSTGTRADITIGVSSTLRTSGALLLDAPGDIALGGTFDLQGAELWLGASAITFGAAPNGTQGLVLDGAKLGMLGLESLVLATPGFVDWYGDVAINVDRLSVRSQGLRSLGTGTVTLAVNDELTLRGTDALASSNVGVDASQLQIAAATTVFEGGALRLDGFAQTALEVNGDVVIAGEGEWSGSGDLRLVSNRIIGEHGSDFDFDTTGNLTIARSAGAPTAGNTAGLGVRVGFSAGSIVHEGLLLLPGGAAELISRTGDVTFGGSSVVDLSGPTLSLAVRTVSVSGGWLSVESAASITIAEGASLDVSSQGTAGSMELIAESGTVSVLGSLRGSGSSRSYSAEIVIDAQQFGDFGALNALLNAGGFERARSLHQRGAGDLILAAGQTIASERLELAADQGSILIQGVIDARADAGGDVRLAASNDVRLEGSILASAQSAEGRGGTVDLMSTTGLVTTTASSLIDVSAGSGTAASVVPPRAGQVNVREHRDQVLAVADGSITGERGRLAGQVIGHESLRIEGYRAYESNDGVIDLTDTDVSGAWFADANAFMSRETDVLNALGLASDTLALVVPGLEIFTTGDMTLADEWSLRDWRFGAATNRPGVLTLRAGGDLSIDRSLSDGFDPTDPYSFIVDTQDSWSYRLTAGAALAAANPLHVQRSADRGSLRVAPGDLGDYPVVFPTPTAIRTGTGTIDISAARDLELGNQASVIYTAGIDSQRGITFFQPTELEGRPYPVKGGDISIVVGGDLNGAPTTQLTSEWLLRTGQMAGQGIPSAATAWTVNHAQFQQGVGALAGGDVYVRAGGDARDFSVAVPTIGRQVGGETNETSVVEVLGGGNIDLRTGGNLFGGIYQVDRGTARLEVGGSAGRDPHAANPNVQLAPVFVAGDSSIELSARGDVGVEAIVNASLIRMARSHIANQPQMYFSTYGDDARTTILSAGGDITLFGGSDQRFLARVDPLGLDQNSAFTLTLATPVLVGVAAGGDIDVVNDLKLYPSAASDLSLLAAHDVTIGAETAIVLSDVDTRLLPDIHTPQQVGSQTGAGFAAHLFIPQNLGPQFNPPRGFFAAVPRHEGPSTPALIAAHEGDVQMLGESSSIIFSAKPIEIHAGRDIVNLNLQSMHADVGDITTLYAGRDITYPSRRSANGSLVSATLRSIAVMGPGDLQLTAGRHIDLQTADGIMTLGNSLNAALPEGGASVSLMAGLRGGTPQYAEFATKYLHESDTYRDELFEFVERYTQRQVESRDEALASFDALPPAQRRILLEQILLQEMRAGGEIGAGEGPDHGDYSRAFNALVTMFPGSNPSLAAEESNAYAGDIRLFFSRIYTEDGGDIRLFAPGGEINVGLAAPPTAFGIDKPPSKLGIVAQRYGSIGALAFNDFQVNESRVFAADGGDILVWSTRGDIDAGRGAKTAISAPPPIIVIGDDGLPRTEFPPALAGSGIQALATSQGTEPGDVALFAPRGVVNAGDAGIVAGNLTIGATAVLGADNIQVSGVAVGVPVDAGGLGASLASVSSVASSANSAAAATLDPNREDDAPQAKLADAALSWLEVFVVGLGEEGCSPSDVDCLKRQSPP